MKKKTCILVYSRIYYVMIFVDSDVLENIKWRMEWLQETKGRAPGTRPVPPCIYDGGGTSASKCYLCT